MGIWSARAERARGDESIFSEICVTLPATWPRVHKQKRYCRKAIKHLVWCSTDMRPTKFACDKTRTYHVYFVRDMQEEGTVSIAKMEAQSVIV